MKFGYRILIHKDVQKEDLPDIKKFLDETISFFNTNGYKCRRQSGAFFRRGILGLDVFNKQKEPRQRKYFFRRLVKNRRIFGVVPISLLEGKEKPFDLNQCMCAIHLGGQKTKLKYDFNQEDYIIYYEIGIIKG